MGTENILNDLQENIVKFLVTLGIKEPNVQVEAPVNFSLGDLSTNVALRCAKNIGLSPEDLAKKIAQYLSHNYHTYISKIEVVAPGYVNIFLSSFFFQDLLKNILRDRSGYGKSKKLLGQKWVVEHTSPNPNKAMHLGHLRNNLVGMGIVRLLVWNGAEVVSDAVDNNRGVAIAKLMWGFLSHMRKDLGTPVDMNHWLDFPGKWYTPQEINLSPDLFVTKCYVLGETDFKKDINVESQVRDLVVKWESNDNATWKLWAHVLTYAYEGINRTLTRLGNHWDKVWHEHEHYQKGKNFIQDGLSKGIFTELEDGAVLTDLKKYNIPDTILLKRDGTSLYITQDVALTALKKEYYRAQKLIWVIGPEQSLVMKQLFAVCEQLGVGRFDDFTHVTYGYVGLKDGDNGFKKMSSREGTVILIDDVIDVVKNKINAKFESEGKKDMSTLKEVSEKMAVAAVKFNLLKSDRNQNLVFDIDKSVETTGDSGVYVLYTYVRTKSILRKVMLKNTEINFPKEMSPEELDVLRSLMFFPRTIERSLEGLSVHHVAQHLLSLCSSFNSWYSKETILDNSAHQSYKVAITEAVGNVLQNGLAILGINTVEEI